MNTQLVSRSRRAHKARRRALPTLAVATSMMASVTLGAQVGAAAEPRLPNGGNVTITAELSAGTGTISSSENVALAAVTNTWEKSHPGVTVDWSPMTYSSAVTANAAYVTEASAGDAPDIIWEQTNVVNSGTVPTGVIANLKSYLLAKDPYDTAYPDWLDTFVPTDPPYMVNAKGIYTIINASAVETGIFYNKAIFAQADISSPPTTYAQWIADMHTIKSKVPGVYPFLFGTGGNCNPSWWERQFSSSMLAPWVKEMDVDHAEILTGVDVATGVAKNVISMKNPAYAEGWELLGQLKPYLAPGASQYDGCANPSTTTPPLSAQSLMVKGKVAMLWGGTWYATQLASQGFTGKWGVFPVPTLTKPTPHATGLNVTGVQGGPYGSGTWSITTERAAHNMTPTTAGLVANLLEYLTAPNVLAKWLPSQGGDYLSLVKGTPPAAGTGVLNGLLPPKLPPTVVEGILDDVLGPGATNSGMRLLQEYMGGSLSFSSFSSDWQSLLVSSAKRWASLNKIAIPGLN
jgi:hypothetical protein